MMTAASVQAVAPVPPRSRAPVRVRLSWFVPQPRVATFVFASIVVTLIGMWMMPHDTLWLPVGLGLTAFLMAHTVLASRRVPWIPGLVACVAAVQWILGAAVTYHLPLGAREQMAVDPSTYFGFVVPALMALVAGMWLPLRRAGRAAVPNPPGGIRMPANLRLTLEVMLWGGLVARVAVSLGVPGPVKFLAFLAAQLAFVAAFALLLARAPGWRLRMLAVFGLEFAADARDGMFLLVVLWGLTAGALLVFRGRLRLRWLLLAGLAGAMVISALNGYKRLYRDDINANVEDSGERVRQSSSRIVELMSEPGSLFSRDNLVQNLGRINQGTITSRVLAWVPDAEPFAGGETVIEAVRASILPRVVAADKYVAGGYESVERFTGMRLIKGTSMNLSIPGEMYANFGIAGGLFGVFVYGLLVGFVFRMFVRLGRRSVLWWAWAPFVLLAVISAEDGLGETLNRITKALVVMAAVVYVAPGWRALRPPRHAARRAMPPLPEVT